jgi:uncharacterized protein YndB with AHSA1/START domain
MLSVSTGMTDEQMQVTTTVNAPVETVFNVLADPSTHQAIDGTGWVRESLDGKRLIDTGQIFRMAMYHDNHPDKDYEMANRVEVFDPPRAIAWQPGQGPTERGNLMKSGPQISTSAGGFGAMTSNRPVPTVPRSR